MDADTRHKLKTNELSELLRKFRDMGGEKVRYWLLGIVAVLVLWLAYTIWGQNSRSARDAAWTDLNAVNLAVPGELEPQIQTLRNLAASAPDAAVAAATNLRLGGGLVRLANAQPENAERLLSEAVTVLRGITENASSHPNIAAPAAVVLGTAYEDQRDFESARKVYLAVSTNARYDGSPHQSICLARVAALDKLAEPITFEPGAAPLANQPSVEPAASQPVPLATQPSVEPAASQPAAVDAKDASASDDPDKKPDKPAEAAEPQPESAPAATGTTDKPDERDPPVSP